jgi:hypothetical protein
VNERLFPEPVGEQEDASIARLLGNDLLTYVRVSVPHRHLGRKTLSAASQGLDTFNPRESVALQQHCQRAYEEGHPMTYPPEPSAALEASLLEEESTRQAHWPYGVKGPRGAKWQVT